MLSSTFIKTFNIMSSSGVRPIAYIAIARGCPCVVPSLDDISLPPMINNTAGIWW